MTIYDSNTCYLFQDTRTYANDNDNRHTLLLFLKGITSYYLLAHLAYDLISSNFLRSCLRTLLSV